MTGPVADRGTGVPPAKPRLNPFAFPSDTAFRFLLLVVSVIAASLFAFDWVHSSYVNRSAQVRELLRCRIAGGDLVGSFGQAAVQDARTATLHACLAPINHARGFWILAGVGVMLLVALAIYLLLPRWRLRRGRLRPLSSADAPDVVAEIERLAGELSIRPLPRLVWNPLDFRATGLAFGRVGRRYVAVSGGLVTLSYTDPDAFRAVLLHELSHVRNRDVDKTYLTMALWYSFVLVAVIPVLANLRGNGAEAAWKILWRLAALVAFVYLSRNAVLRAREIYADVRASLAPSGAAGIRRAVGGLRVEAGPWWRRPLRLHPDPRDRTATLDDTDRLFRLGLWEPFAAGVALTIAFHQLQSLIGLYYWSVEGQMWTAALGVATLVAGVVGLGIWRAAFAARARGTSLAALWRVGAALAAGFLLGEWLSLENIGAGGSGVLVDAVFGTGGPRPLPPIVSTAVFGWGIVWVLAVVAGLVLYACWIGAGAELWLARAGTRLTRLAATAGIAAAAAVLTVWTGIFFLLHDVSAPIFGLTGKALAEEYDRIVGAIEMPPLLLYRLVFDAQGQYLASRWPLLPTIGLLWIFPLAALLVRREDRTPAWAFLDEGRLAEPPPRPRVRSALLVGAGLGVAYLVGIEAWQGVLHASVPVERRNGDDFILGFQYWRVLAAVALEVAAAVVVAATARLRPVLQALLAAGVAGAIASLAMSLSTTVGSCVTPLAYGAAARGCPRMPTGAFVEQVFQFVIVQGAVYALVAALVVVGARRLVRLRREARDPGAARASAEPEGRTLPHAGRE